MGVFLFCIWLSTCNKSIHLFTVKWLTNQEVNIACDQCNNHNLWTDQSPTQSTSWGGVSSNNALSREVVRSGLFHAFPCLREYHVCSRVHYVESPLRLDVHKAYDPCLPLKVCTKTSEGEGEESYSTLPAHLRMPSDIFSTNLHTRGVKVVLLSNCMSLIVTSL